MKVGKGTRECVFCKQPALDTLDYGEFKVTKNLRAHYYCLLFSETITQSGSDRQGILGFLPSDILSELCRAKQKRCYYCKELGANAGCASKFCNIKFHLPCGMRKNTQHDFNNFMSYCVKHRKSSNVPVHLKRAISDYQCVICLENFPKKIDMKNVIWADCCKAEILLHLECMKKLALSAGYFTKCPGCNNKTDFVTTVKFRGVFVPERDASWELTSDAYSELYHVHDTCDVEKCCCPHGRNYSVSKGKWKFFLCKLCGSFGTHQYCSKVRKEFVCSVCGMDEDSVIGSGNSTSVTHSPASTANNYKRSNRRSKASEPSADTSFKSSKTHSNTQQTPAKNVEIDPLDDIIVVDEDDSSDEEFNKVALKLEVLKRISDEVTVTTGAILNKPTTSRIKTDSSHPRTERRVAMKSTTKLPQSEEKLHFSAGAVRVEEKIINPLNEIIIPEFDFARYTDCKKKLDGASDHGVKYTSHNTSRTTPDRFKSRFSHGIQERRIALKSTTKLPFMKREFTSLDSTILEKQTINSLDDVIVIDSDDEENDSSEVPKVIADLISKSVRVKTDEASNITSVNMVKSEPSHSQTGRKVALKSTTKLPFLKRKNMDEEHCYTSARRPIKKFRSSYVAKMRTPHKSTSRLHKLIKKVHTAIGNQYACDASNPVEGHHLASVTHPIGIIQDLCNQENHQHYSVPLEVDGEIEFTNSPTFRVSAQEKACQDQ